MIDDIIDEYVDKQQIYTAQELNKRVTALRKNEEIFFNQNQHLPLVISDNNYLFEVADEEFRNFLTYDEAKLFCFSMGNGWRIPTSDELLFYFSHKVQIKYSSPPLDYWTSSHMHQDTNIKYFSCVSKKYEALEIDYSNDTCDSRTQQLEKFNIDDIPVTINYERWSINKYTNYETKRCVLIPVRDLV